MIPKTVPSLAIVALLIHCFGLCSAAGAKTMVRSSPSVSISSAYFDLVMDNYKFPTGLRGRGGALVIENNYIVLGSADNHFFRIDPKTWEYEENYLPPLITGEEDLPSSARYTYREILPRVEGLLLHNKTFYVTYTRYSKSDDYIYFELARLKPGETEWHTIYKSPGLNAPYYSMGSGGRMVVSPKQNRLYFSVGDFSLDRINNLPSDIAPQNPNLPWGKVNYIDLKDHSFHPYTLGHRNPQGLVLLRDGRLLLSEHGPQGGDELNVLEEGKNYGWPYASFGTVYGSFDRYSDRLPPLTGPVNFNAPLYAFLPSPAISQLVQVTGFHPRWINDVLLGSLKAMTLFHIKLADDRVIFVEPIMLGCRIRDIKEFDACLYILSDEGTIIRLKPLSSNSQRPSPQNAQAH